MIGFLIALLSGALMSIQGVFNTQVTKNSSIWTASAFVQFTSLLVCLGAWLCTERTSFLKVWQVEPKYMLLGGAIGAFITYTVIRSMDALGPAKAVMLIVTHNWQWRISSNCSGGLAWRSSHGSGARRSAWRWQLWEL